MLSRTAAAFFWIGRYIERAEYTARLINVHYHLMLEGLEGAEQSAIWQRLLDHHGDWPLYQTLHPTLDPRQLLNFFTLERENHNAIAPLVSATRENARSIQDQLSSEVWHHINEFHLGMQETTLEYVNENPYQFLTHAQNMCYMLSGVIGSTMLHDEGWSFYRLGKEIERAGRTARLLMSPVLLAPESEPAGLNDFHQCIAVLKSASAHEAYRKVYRSALVPTKIVDFLLLNDRFPRSVRFCAKTLQQILKRLMEKSAIAREPERLIGQLAADLDYAILEEIDSIGLANFLGELLNRLDAIAEAIARAFFRQGENIDRPVPQSRKHRLPVIHAPVLREQQGILAVRNQFTYRYDAPVEGVRTMIRLCPNQHYGRQRLLDVRWDMSPPGLYRHYADAFGNLVWQMDHARTEDEITCTVEMRIETRASYASDDHLAWQGVSSAETDCAVDEAEFLQMTPLVDRSEALLKLAQRVCERTPSPQERAEAFLNQVHACLAYETGKTTVHTTASEALALGMGVCQDFAHVMLSLCRIGGLPARYVSGYLPGEGQMHAWVEVLLPVGPDQSLLWVAYDPTHQRRADERYISVAIGRDYRDIAPTSGYYYGQAGNELVSNVSVLMEFCGPAGHSFAVAKSLALEEQQAAQAQQ